MQTAAEEPGPGDADVAGQLMFDRQIAFVYQRIHKVMRQSARKLSRRRRRESCHNRSQSPGERRSRRRSWRSEDQIGKSQRRAVIRRRRKWAAAVRLLVYAVLDTDR